MTDVLRSLTCEEARDLVGSRFQVRFDDGLTVDLQLEEVVLVMEKHVSPQMHRDAFAMHFRGPRNQQLQQGTYPIVHDTLGGPLPMFIVPIAVEQPGVLYEAIFS